VPSLYNKENFTGYIRLQLGQLLLIKRFHQIEAANSVFFCKRQGKGLIAPCDKSLGRMLDALRGKQPG
jgi:hypothetical protein